MLVYTFRGFPFIAELQGIFGDVFVFGKLRQDFAAFEQLLQAEPGYVLGVAFSKRESRVEPVAINQFNKGKVLADGPETLQLTLPAASTGITIAGRPTHTFCNWTMYRIQNAINEQQLATQFSFIHIAKHDIALLRTLQDARLTAKPW